MTKPPATHPGGAGATGVAPRPQPAPPAAVQHRAPAARPVDAVAALVVRDTQGRRTWIEQHQPTLSSKDIAFLLETVTAIDESFQDVKRLNQLSFMAPCLPKPVTARDLLRILRIFPSMSCEQRFDALCMLTDDASKVGPLTPREIFSLGQAVGEDDTHPSYGSIAMHHLLSFQSRPLTFDDLATAARSFTTCSDCVAQDLSLLAEREIVPLSFGELVRLCSIVGRYRDRATIFQALEPHLAGGGTLSAEEEAIVRGLFRPPLFS